MAACLVLVMSALLTILPNLNDPSLPPVDTEAPSYSTDAPIPKQVPIYEGMTASGTNPSGGHTTASVSPKASTVPLHSGLTSHRLSLLTDTKPVSSEENTEDLTEGMTEGMTECATEGMTEGATEAVTDAFVPDVETTEDIAYYAKPHEDFYITVHISNPDSYEILSFTLNGKKYSSYMFEPGSDMENLILKCNVDDTQSIVTYTIDAIKYVDGEELKDVQMEGNQTIKIGVHREQQPTATVTSYESGLSTLTFSGVSTDELGLMELSDGQLYALLIHGANGHEISKQAMTVGEEFLLTFEGLTTGTEYVLRIVAEYDALDGAGIAGYVLSEQAASTHAFATFENVSVGSDRVTFDLVWNTAVLEENKVSLTLYKGDEVVRELDLTATVADSLLSHAEYTLIASYRNGDIIETISYAFTTGKKATPTLTLTKGDVTHSSLSFEMSYTDRDEVGRISKIELLHGEDEPIVADSLDVRFFDNLLAGNTYTVQVTVTYDLNLGKGERTMTERLEIDTKAYAKPKVALGNDISATTSALQGSYTVTDKDSKVLSVQVELFKGNDRISLADASPFAFEGLTDFTNYTVKVVCTYDLLDGKGVQTVTAEKTVTTPPVLEVEALNVWGSSTIAFKDTIQFKATLQNPQNATVTSLVINGHTVAAKDLIATSNQLHFAVVNNGQFGVGQVSFTIEKITLNCGGQTFTVEPLPVASPAMTVRIGTANLKSFTLVDENFAPINEELVTPEQTALLMLQLDNPDGYDVESITVRDMPTTWSKINSQSYVLCLGDNHSADHKDCPYAHASRDHGWLTYSVNDFTINVDGVLQKVSCENASVSILRLVSSEVKYISTPEELMDVDDNYYYELTQDIDLAGIEWTPVTFNGYLNGNGYAVKNLTIIKFLQEPHLNIYGLFSTAQGSITNLHMESATIALNIPGDEGLAQGYFVGLIAGYFTGTMSHCSADAASSIGIIVTVTESHEAGQPPSVGGLIGRNNGSSTKIKNCVFEGNVHCAAGDLWVFHAGGIVGFVYNTEISNCLNNGSFEQSIGGYTTGHGAGIVYYSFDTSVTSCVNLKELPTAYKGSLVLQNNYSLYPVSSGYLDYSEDNPCTVEQLNDKSFWTDVLGWDEEIWNFDDLDYENGKIPTLRREHK